MSIRGLMMNNFTKKIFGLIFAGSSVGAAIIVEKIIEAKRRKQVMDSSLEKANRKSEARKNEKYN